MGLIKAVLNSAGGVMADQWKEYFYCEALPSDVLVSKGQKKVSGRSENTKGSENVISKGSVIAVADGQCVIIVDQGKIVDLCAETGEYTFDNSSEPSIFGGGKLSTNLKEVFSTIGQRISFGGETPKDQRIYYFNTKEIMGNKYGTPQPVPFRVVDQRAGIDIDISIRCFGEYSYKITNPILFYANVCGNISGDFRRSDIEGQLRTEFLTALQPAFARLSDAGIRYSSLPGHTTEMADAMRDELSVKWRDKRGIEIAEVGVSSVSANEEDEKLIKQMQRDAAYVNPGLGAAAIVGATKDAMVTAAGNAGGAAVGFMGMNVAQGAAGNMAQNLYAMNQAQAPAQAAPAAAPAAPAADSWTCECGTVNTGKFCANCGTAKPVPAATWTCECGTVNTGKFCPNCGKQAPAAEWTCECGTVNTGKFCPNCGKQRP